MPQPEACRLLVGPAAWLAQAILALMAMAALIYKRHRERPQRSLEVWGYDVTKQVLSMLVAHTCGLVIASLVAEAGHRMVSDCAWYFVAFMFDTTLGVALTIGLHSLVLRAAKAKAGSSSFSATIFNCGNYGTPPQWKFFWPQVLEWIMVTILARILCGSIVFMLRGLLVHIARGLDAAFRGHPIVMLYFVMICCPLLMNIVQAVLQDIALKWRGSHDEESLDQQAEQEQTWEMSEGPLLSPTQKTNLEPIKIEVK